MRTLPQVGLTVLLIGAIVAGCSSDRLASAPTEPSVELELVQLRQQIHDLKGAVETAGRMTPELQAEVENVRTRVENWQRRSGRSDISVSSGQRSHENMTTSVAALTRGDPAPSGCVPCPPVTVINGKICFLELSNCSPGQTISRWCQYACFYL